MPQLGEIKYGRDIGKKDERNKYIWSACRICGNERWVIHCRRDSICRACQLEILHANIGSKNPCWSGGRVKKEGYFTILLQPDDFFYPMSAKTKAKSFGRYVYEHRLVMAKHLNRCLLPWEVVHHKNGVKDDNRIENLQLLGSASQHLPDSVSKAKIRKLIKEVELLKERIEKLEKEGL